MTQQKLQRILSQKTNLFFILAFLPLILLEYYRYVYFNDALGAFIPMCGFLLLLIKKDKLLEYSGKIIALQKISGIAIIVSSFFISYVIVIFVPIAGFYGLANYLIYLTGLILLFFRISAFRQAFTAFFLITSIGLTGLTFRWIENQSASTVPYYVSLFSSVLNALGLVNGMSDPTTIILYTPQGMQPVGFEAGCIGIYSIILFSIIIVTVMAETIASRKTKVLWSIIGFLGVLTLNIIRLLIVVISMYFYGVDFGQQVHQVIGYILFLSWLGLFFLLFSKRQLIIGKIVRAP